MKLMYSETGGFHNFSDDDAEVAQKDGWVDGEPIRQKLLDAKRGIAPTHVPAIIEAPAPKRGRPFKGTY